MHIRDAVNDDMVAVTAIYGEAVLHGTASFETTPPTESEMRRRFAGMIAGNYPYLVAEDAKGTILGYAYAGPYRTRPAYRWSVENSVYVMQTARGQGIGKKLLNELIDCCQANGFRQMIAIIGDSANTGSIALHSACGFQMVGTLRSVGRKHGKWLDTVLMQLTLGSSSDVAPENE